MYKVVLLKERGNKRRDSYLVVLMRGALGTRRGVHFEIY